MTRPTTPWIVGSLAALLVLGAALDAHALVGSGVLKGRSSLTVKSCGRDRGRFGAVVSLNEDGTWTAENPEVSVGGTWTAIGTAGRKFALDFDPASFTRLFDPIAADVTQLCKRFVTPTSTVKRRFTLTLNRRRTRATLSLEYRFTGTSASGSGTAKYVLSGSGRWAAG
jgi:hypothetical protein